MNGAMYNVQETTGALCEHRSCVTENKAIYGDTELATQRGLLNH